MRSSNFKAGINVPYGWDKVPSANRKTAPRAKHDLDAGAVPNFRMK